MKIAINGEILEVSGGGGVPKGTIVIWSGAATAIPSGWALCDGQNGTPDLRDRFVVGAGTSYEVGATGGEATHTLTIEEMPVHRHLLTSNVYSGTGTNSGLKWSGDNGSTSSGTSTDTNGGSVSHNNLPPYYALCYIMKMADGGSGSSAGSSEEVYSTEEIRIGTWIDGKPLYRRVAVTKDIPQAAGQTKSIINFSEDVSIVYMLGSITASDNKTYVLSGSSFTATSNNGPRVPYSLWYAPSTRMLGMSGFSGDFIGGELKVIVAYTKTTDEAAS